jgi:hypothetical protein
MSSAFSGGAVSAYSTDLIGGLMNIKGTVPPALLQLIVGVFTGELLFLIGAFCAGLERGTEDITSIKSETGSLLAIGMIVYICITSFVTLFFSSLVANLIQ